ncbi:Threonine/homoserine efflux transporter RhtA [Andreprevotia lacus DSM 23236]|uniref:Threonine/homoserine efflux transporter RhtA n=1 Tax=Andreprevotia lacus DSM 23236 TaxID=1121001 RepID=A0A1W1XVE1_9NEIS|nr:DMT family transporter [Andreprevotia lacus]SMC27498.1 Threonine/homoserine efflux transporter RhtA [Andreprevotia lacus DSM 23236]
MTSTAIPHPAARAEQLGVILAIVSATCFATKAIFVKLAYRHGVDAVTLLTLRLVGTLGILGLLRLLWRRPAQAPMARRDIGWLLLLGFLGYYLASVTDFIGLQTVSASLERLVLYLYPTLTVLFTAVLTRSAITRRTMGALALTYVGIVLVVWPGLHDAHADVAGLLWVFASNVAFALYLTFSPPLIARVGSLRFTEMALSVSAGLMLGHFLLTHPATQLIQPWPVYAYAGVMAAVATVLPLYLMAMAMQRIGAGRTAVVGSFGPIITIVLGMGVLDEHLSAVQWLGAVVVLGGVALVSRK